MRTLRKKGKRQLTRPLTRSGRNMAACSMTQPPTPAPTRMTPECACSRASQSMMAAVSLDQRDTQASRYSPEDCPIPAAVTIIRRVRQSKYMIIKKQRKKNDKCTKVVSDKKASSGPAS